MYVFVCVRACVRACVRVSARAHAHTRACSVHVANQITVRPVGCKVGQSVPGL